MKGMEIIAYIRINILQARWGGYRIADHGCRKEKRSITETRRCDIAKNGNETREFDFYALQLRMRHYKQKRDMNTKCCRNALSSRHCRKIRDPKRVTYGSFQWPLFNLNFVSETRKFNVHRKAHSTENTDPITVVLHCSGIRQIDLMSDGLKFNQSTC